MSSCDNSNIRKNYIVQGGNEFDIISACTGVYTNNLYNCTGDTITIQSTNLSANTINATVYLSGGTNLLDIFSGDSNTFVTGFTYDNSNNLTISRSDNVSFGVNITEFSGITVNGVLSACTGIYTSNIYGCSPITVQDNLILNSGLTFNTISNNNTIDRLLVVNTGGTVEYRDANSLMTATTFVTGVTYTKDYAVLSRNDGFDVLKLSGGTNVTLKNPSLNEIVIDVTIPPDTNTFVTGFTYDDINTFTITRNDGTAFTQSITVLSATTISGGTFFGDGSNLTGISTQDTFVTGGTYSDLSDTISFTNNTGGTFNVTGITDTFVTGQTFSNSTYILSTTRNDGVTLDTNLSVLASDVFVVSGVYDPATGIVTYTNSTGGTFQVSGFTTGMTDSYTTDAYLSGSTIRFDNNIQGTNFYNVDLLPLLSGKTDNTTFNTYTSDTQTILDSKISGATNLSSTGIFAQKNGDDLEFKGLTSTGGSITITSNSTTVNLESVIPPATNTFVTGGTYNESTDTITLTRNDAVTIDITGVTDTFTTGATYDNGTTLATFTKNDGTTYTLDLSTIDVNDTFSTGGTVTQSPTSGSSEVIVQIVGNDGFTPFNITGLTDTFINDFSISSNTFTISQNDGTSFVATADTIDLASVLSAVTFDIGTSGSISATTFNGTTFSGGTFYGDGSNLTGITDTFVTGTTFGSNQAVLTRNDGVDIFKLSGGSNVTLSNPSSNQIKIDVALPPSMNTFTTGFTYDDANTLTIERNDGVNLDTTINTVTALTVTNYVDYTTTTKPSAISGRTYFDRDENALSYFPETPANDVTINIGQESVIRVHNNTGVQINNGQVCHISSDLPSVNGVPSVVLAIATGSTTTGSKYLVSGVATHDIPNGTEGFITEFGLVRDLNITGVTEGSEIYLSETTPGAFRYTAPDTEFRRSVVGYVVTTGTTTGKILVEITNEVGFSELSESLLSVVTENNASTGTRDGGEITINSGDNTLFDISSGSGIIVDNYTNPNSPTITNVVWDDITGNTVTNLTADTASFIFLNSSLNTVQFGISNPPTEADYRDNIFLGIVGHANFTNLINVFNTPIQIVSPINQHQDLTSAIGPFSISGNRIDNIIGTLELQKSAGLSYFYGGNFHTDNKVPSNISTSQLSGSTLIYATGAAVLGPSGTTVDPNNYDPNGAGTITAIPGSNNYVAHRVWHQPSQNLLIFQYGQEFYANAATARDEFEFEDFVVPPGLNEVSYLVAVIITQDGSSDLDSATIIPQGKFAGTGGGGGSAADTLQTAYDNSSSPEIVTDPTRGAVDFRVGSGSDSDNLVTFQQSSGTINSFVEGTGNAKFETLSGDSLNILSLPTLNNSATDILVRNSSTGVVEYRPVSGITPDTNTFVTGGTYNDSTDTITLTRNDAVTIDITGVTDNFVIAGTYSDSTDTISLLRQDGSFVNITGVTDTFTTGATYDNGTALATFTKNDNTTYTLDLSTIDVNDTFVTGFTYNDANTFTISRNDDVDITTSFNIVTGLTINGNLVVTGTTNISGITTVDSTLQVDGNVNITSNSFFFQGTSVGGGNVSLIGVDSSDVVRIGNLGFDNYIEDDTTINGVLTADTIFLATLPTLNNSGTDLLVRNTTTGEIEYRPVSGITPDTNTFVTGSTVSANTLTISRNDLQNVLELSGGTNIQFIDNGNNSITLNATSGGGGASVSFPWKFKEPTTSGDPGNGQFRLNNSIASGITEIYVNDETNNGIDASNFLNILDIGDIIYIQQNDDASRALLFSVSASTIDNTGWFTIPVEYLQGSTIPKKDKICGWIFLSSGAEDNTVSNVGVGQGIFKQRNVNDFEFYSLSGGSNTTLSLNSDTIVIDVALPPSMNTYVTGGTYNDSTDTITLTRNDAVNVDITGITDTFVTGTTFGSNQAVLTRNDDVDVLLLTGGTNVTLSNPSTNQIKIDVQNTLSVVSVTGTTYSATTSDDVIGFDTTSVTPTLFLPDSTISGTIRYEVKDIGVNSRRNPITIQASGSDTIITTSVVSSFELSADGGAVILVSTGSGQWWQM